MKNSKIKLKYIEFIVAIIVAIIGVSPKIISTFNENGAKGEMVKPNQLKGENKREICGTSLFKIPMYESGDSDIILKEDRNFDTIVQCIRINAHGYLEMPDLFSNALQHKTALIYNLEGNYTTFKFFCGTSFEEPLYLLVYGDNTLIKDVIVPKAESSKEYVLEISDVDKLEIIAVFKEENSSHDEAYVLIMYPELF